MIFAFYVSNTATRLRKYLSGWPGAVAGVAAVIHDGDCSDVVGRACADAEVDFVHMDYTEPGSGRNRECSERLLAELERRRVDYCFCFGARILKGAILDRYMNRIVNFHPSVLPGFPGLASVDQALRYGALILGNTSHFIDAGVDTGPVIMQSLCSRADYSGYDSVLDLQLTMLVQIKKWLERGRVSVSGRVVEVEGADYGFGRFIPALEA